MKTKSIKALFPGIVLAALFAHAGIASAQTTVGTGAFAQSGVAVGQNAMQVDVAAGYFSPTQPAYSGGISIGRNTNVSGKNVAIGDGLSAPQDGIEGSYSFVIGGLNSNNGLVEYRRVVGMANGLFANDGANLGQAISLADAARNVAMSYTDNAVAPLSMSLFDHTVRLGNVETTTSANTARLDQHDIVLTDHDARIVTAQNTADTALTTAVIADNKATTAINVSGQAMAVAQQTQQEVAVLTGRVDGIESRMDRLEAKVDGMDKRINGGVAISSAMSAAVAPSLQPGDSAIVAGVGGFRGQGAISIGLVHSNYAGQTVSAKVSTSSVGTAVAVGGAWKF